MVSLGVLDWTVLGLFFLALLAIVVWVVLQKEKDTEDYFLAGRDATWLAIGASIFASNIGSEHLVGLAGSGAQTGMAFAHWELHSYLVIILAWVFVPFYWRSKVFTTPEFLEKRYSPATRGVLSFISLISYVLTKVSVTVYAGGVVVKSLLGYDTILGIDTFWVAALGLVLVTGLYTVFGGMKAVLWTSVLQTPVLLIGSIVILWVGLDKIGGWDAMMAANTARADGDQTHLWRPLTTNEFPALLFDKSQFPWLGVLLASPIIGLWYWCTDQYIVQRVLSAKGLDHARRGAIWAGYLKLFPVFIFLLPGMVFIAMAQQGQVDMAGCDPALGAERNCDAVFPTLVTTLLPDGLRGMVAAGLLAALMSSLASLFNSSATLFTVDFYKKWRPQSSEPHLVLVGRIATGSVVVLGVVWIPVMSSIADYLYQYLQVVQSLIAPAIAAVFMLGIFSSRMTPLAGLVGLLSGFVLGMTRLGLLIARDSFGVDLSGLAGAYTDINWLYFCFMLFVFTCVLMWVVSLFGKAPSAEKIEGLTYASITPAQKAEARASYNVMDIVHSAIIVGVIAAVYIYFW